MAYSTPSETSEGGGRAPAGGVARILAGGLIFAALAAAVLFLPDILGEVQVLTLVGAPVAVVILSVAAGLLARPRRGG